jgi:hypothetical protein
MGLLDWEGSDSVPGNSIMPPCESHLFAFQQALNDRNRLGQPLDPGGSGIEGQARLFIFRLDAPGTQAELKSPVRQKINCRSLARD